LFQREKKISTKISVIMAFHNLLLVILEWKSI
jgi:hypothetical protein